MAQEGKRFKDSVHGYILVPETYIINIIDTPIFQRLKNIEQTSYRTLFHCARHDRFSHSLGVYHLATKVYDQLLKNSNSEEINTILEKAKDSFFIAALVHDCAHTPFSHTLEDMLKSKPENELMEIAESNYPDLKSDKDSYFRVFENKKFKNPANHEFASALLYLKYFHSKIESKVSVNPELIARMIIGLPYQSTTIENNIHNSLIRFINGDAIDVDKLDYLLRDTWSSGLNNINLDIDRLLSSLSIRKYLGVYREVFDISSIFIIEDVVNGINNLKERMTSHHTTLYYKELLKISVDKLIDLLDVDKLISFEMMTDHTAIDGFNLKLICDGDILFLLKHYRYKDNALDLITKSNIDEIISRQPTRKPLWKTYFEYKTHFKDISNNDQSFLYSIIAQLINDYFNNKNEIIDIRDIIVTKANPNSKNITNSAIYINQNDDIKTYNDFTMHDTGITDLSNYFIVFIPTRLLSYKNDCIQYIKQKAITSLS